MMKWCCNHIKCPTNIFDFSDSSCSKSIMKNNKYDNKILQNNNNNNDGFYFKIYFIKEKISFS